MVKILKIKIFFFAFLFILFPFFANAANLSFSKTSGSYNAGDTFTVNVYINSTDQSMNAASGVVLFPTDLISVSSISKNGSIFSLWVQEPLFSNNGGTVNFEGIVLNPGFIGSNGKILSITFKTKKVGNAEITFSTGSVLANDGKGTNILTNTGKMSVNIGEKPAPKETPVPEKKIEDVPTPITKDANTDDVLIVEETRIDPPVITSYTKKIKQGVPIEISGKAHPNSSVIFVLTQKEDIILEKVSQSIDSGQFSFIITDELNLGIYDFILYSKTNQNISSITTNPLPITIRENFISKYLNLISNKVNIILSVTVILLIIAVAYLLYQSLKIIHSIRQKTHEAENIVKMSFDLLKKDVGGHISKLKKAKLKRALSKEEISFLKNFEKDLEDAKNITTEKMEKILNKNKV